MPRAIRLNRLGTVTAELEYPVSNDEVRDSLADVTLLYADGQEPLADVLARSTDESFTSPEDLEAEIYTNLPVEAVGEPGQSEGEG